MQIQELLNRVAEVFDSTSRLYRLEAGDAANPINELMVESWAMKESLDAPWEMQLNALALSASLDHHAMPAQRVTLWTALSDGGEVGRTGIVTSATSLGADGGLARYCLTVKPWIALLAHTTRSQVWQEKTLVEIVESVFSRYARFTSWRWSADVAAHLAASPRAGSRSYTVQWRETDLAFVQRLLAERGIGYRFEEDPAAPMGHTLVFFADSPSQSSCPEDASSAGELGGRGIRFHRASALEAQDAIQALGAQRFLPMATVSAVGYDYKTKRVIAASLPTAAAFGGANAPRLENYTPMGAYPFANTGEGEWTMRLLQESIEVRHKSWLGRSTVRTLTAGTTFALTGSPLDVLDLLSQEGGQDKRFLVTAVTHAGINNLPKEMSEQIAAAAQEQLPEWVSAEVREQAARSGYGNGFEAVRAHVPWRPALLDGQGRPLHARPAVPPMIATVVGPRGETAPSGADEIHTDRLGRVRIQYDFQTLYPGQDTSNASTWVRVAQRYAGPGMGWQFIPRIGQQVLVQFIDGNPERPVVVATLYTGRGEGGVQPTPGGGEAAMASDASVFEQAQDHRPGGQGNLAGGHSPAWHSASGDDKGHRNAGALSGFKTKEFGGEGYNQLVFDDTNGQLRVQLATTQHGTQLNMGHLLHQADNYRGSFRGLGFELRTDAWGAIRGGRGVLISTFGIDPSEPAGDNAAGMALVKQMMTLAEAFNGAAKTHEVVQLSGHIGTFAQTRSAIDDKAAVLAGLHKAVKGMVSEKSLSAATADAAKKSNSTAEGMLPHTTDPVVAISAQGGFGLAAGQDVQIAAGENVMLASGKDTHVAVGGAARIHAGQAVGMLAGAIKPGSGAAGTGLTVIAGHGQVDVQAQAGPMQIAAMNDVSVKSANAHIDWAAAKKIVVATAGGASITIEGGNITVQCPGKITVNAGKKSFIPGQQMSYEPPPLPRVPMEPVPARLDLRLMDVPGPEGVPLAHAPWEIVLMSGGEYERVLFSGQSDAEGRMPLDVAQQEALIAECSRRPNNVWLSVLGELRPLWLERERDDWTDERRAVQALAALDYSDDAHWGLGEGQPGCDEAIVRTDTGRSAYALWSELKKT